ncbi:unnamed protein product [Auanema sp. JU1783]|nr:unnamed protein product [Auanema sp. JU1783]
MRFDISLQAILFLSFAVLISAQNCSRNKDGRTLECYTCLGRDMENCNKGSTCCKGSCFKLIDVEHNLIIKGCNEGKEEDASMKVRELAVPLYWSKNENVKGESYFCSSKAFCNESATKFHILAIMSSCLFALLWIQ